MTEETASTKESPRPTARRRASRAAGPASGAVSTSTGVPATPPKTVKVRLPRVGPPPRRKSHGALVAWVAVATTLVAVVAVAAVVGLMFNSQRKAEAAQAQDQRYVDTASQFVVNMFSYTQDNIDDSVNRFVNSTSGPLRDMMSQGQNTDNLKLLFKDTNASSEAVINGAALEKVDTIARNADVLVAVRVTVTDIDGNNAPSRPYRLRVVVHEDDNGNLSFYDLKYPDGGN
jgi:Mce-associated membrane protein